MSVSIKALLLCVFAAIAAISVAQPPPAPFIPQVLPQDKQGAYFVAGNHDKFGTNVHAQVQQRLWQSDNKRHEIHGGASYSQHLGGPYGNGPANKGYGGSYVYRW